MADVDAKNVELIGTLYEEANASGLALFKQQTIYATIFEQLAYKPIDKNDNADLIAKCKAGAFSVAQAIYNNYESNLVANGDTDTSAKYFARVSAAGTLKYFLGLIDITGVDGAADFNTKANAAIAAAADEVSQKRTDLDDQADFAQYDLVDGRQHITLEDGKTLSTTNSNSTNMGLINTDAKGNKYFTLHYGSEKSHLFTEPSLKTDDLGLVLSMDLMFDSNFVGMEFVARQPSVVMQTLFTMSCSNRDGNILLRPVKGSSGGNSYNLEGTQKELTGVIVPNVWFNLTVTFDNIERKGDVYINYEKVLTIDYHETIKFGGYRIGMSSVNQELSIDNIDFFQGTQFRIWDKFQNKSDNELFKFFVDYCTNEKYTATNRNAAYLRARELKSSIGSSAELDEYKARFDALDYEEDVKKPAMKANLEEITKMVDRIRFVEVDGELVEKKIDSTNRLDVALQVQAVEQFITKNAELINRADADYLVQADLINGLKNSIQRVIYAEDFITAVSKFYRTTTTASASNSMSKHAAVAKGIYDLAKYGVDGNIQYVENDPVVREFEKNINVKDALPTDEGYITVFEYYLTFVDLIAERVKLENSGMIIDCIGFITSLEGYEATEEFWGANIDFISMYVRIIREIVVINNYNADVEGVEDAIAAYYELDAYFYELLQQQHIDVISEQLQNYLATSSYIEKKGFCAYIADYVLENDLVIYNDNLSDIVAAEVSDEALALNELMYLYNQYLEELESQEADYASILEANTVAFIGTVKTMTSVVTYTELKPLVELAGTYYYGMNTDSAEAKEAVALYNSYVEFINDSERNAEYFIKFASEINNLDAYEENAREEVLYNALVTCATLVDFVNTEVEGVTEAVELYTAAAEEYNARVSQIIADINGMSGVAFAVRADFVVNTALAIVAGFMNAFN